MNTSQHEMLLKDFEPYFNCPLEFDSNNSCLIMMPDEMTVQIEFNRYGVLIIACRVGIVEGRFRDLVFKEALRANYFYPPSQGVFGFSKKTNQLFLYKMVDPQTINKHEIGLIFDPLIKRGKNWAESLARNEIPELEITLT